MTTRGAKTIEGLRWYIAGLLCLATALNYLDRQILALLGPTLERELGITTIQYSYITTAFLVSYTVMYAVSGRLIDRLGARRGFAMAVCAWSGADLLHAFARTARQFSLCRFLLGAAEPANFPAAFKTVSEWFPVRERALAVGIFNSGTALGAGLAAPLVALITLGLGWRWTFVVSAGLGLAWVVLWRVAYRSPRRHPRLGAEELRLIEEGIPPAEDMPPVPLRRILRLPEAWGCILARMATDPISYFFAFWMPKFLQQERGFDLAAIGRYYWIPYLGLGIGNLASGAIPRWLIGQGMSVNRARKTVMFAASCLMPACFILITRVPNPGWAVALISIAMFAHCLLGQHDPAGGGFPERSLRRPGGPGAARAMGSLVSAFVMLAIRPDSDRGLVHSRIPDLLRGDHDRIYCRLPLSQESGGTAGADPHETDLMSMPSVIPLAQPAIFSNRTNFHQIGCPSLMIS